MKKNLIILFMSICCSVPLDLFGQESVERTLDIDKSIFYAHRNRKEILFAQQEIDLSKERVSEARSFKFPKVDFVFNYVQIDKDKTVILPPNFGSLFIEPTDLGQYYFTRLSLWQNIYSGGRYTSSLKLAESNLSRARNQLNIVKNNVSFEVEKAFYELLAVEEKMKVYEQVIPVLDKQPDIEKLEINREITGIKDDYSMLINNQYQQYKLDFLNTLGLELDTVFGIKGEFKPITENYNLNELLAWAFQYRTEPRQFEVEEEMDSLSMKLSMAARYPTVTLGINYDFGNDQFSDMFREKVGNVTLNFDLPLFDGWASWARIGQKRLQLEQGKLQRKNIEDSIRLEVRKSHNDYQFWVQEVAKRENELKKYEELLKSAGSKNPAALIETYNGYLNSKIRQIDGVCKNLISYAALEHAVGKPLKSE